MNGTHLILDRAAVAVAGPPRHPDANRKRFVDLERGDRLFNSRGNAVAQVVSSDLLAVTVSVAGIDEPVRFSRSVVRADSIALDVAPRDGQPLKLFMNQSRAR